MISSVMNFRELSTEAILQAIRDESMYDPRERIEIAQSHSLYRPTLLCPQ
jgi:glycerol-3-phosphate dehydrogenase (NAD+)